MRLPANFSNETPGQGAKRHERWTRWRVVKWVVRVAVVSLAAGYLVLVGFDSFFYYPDRELYYRPEQFGLTCEPVRFQTRDGLTLDAWFLPAQDRPRGTVVHFHGNAANISNHVALVEWLPRVGYNLLMFDYRGYGDSEGRPTREGTIKDGHAALDYVLSRADLRSDRVFFYGQSLGAAVAVVVAAERPEVAAVIAESPFSGYRRIAAEHLRRRVYFGWLARGIAALGVSSGYDPIDVVERISPRPLLVIVAGKDQICFPELGRELFAAAGEPKEFWCAEGAAHLGILEEHDVELTERIVDFLDRAAGR